MSPFLKFKLALNKAFFSFGTFGTHRAAIAASQRATFRKNNPVKVYKTIEEITEATSKLVWTEDPWDGKIDIIKHPSFMQEAIETHPAYSGDCDDFAAYWVCALRKSRLADASFMAFAFWEKDNDIAGHAVCVYLKDGSWWWVGNWFKCVPQKIPDAYGWISAIQDKISKDVLLAGRILVDGIAGDDTVLVGPALRCK